MDARDLARIFSMHSFRCGREIDLQTGVELALAGVGVPYEREYRFDHRNRIEIKITGSLSSVIMQLDRYAKFPQVNALVLLTTKRTHLAIDNAPIGKPVQVVLARGLGL